MRPQYTSTYQLLACCKLLNKSAQDEVIVKPQALQVELTGIAGKCDFPPFGGFGTVQREIFKKYLKLYVYIYKNIYIYIYIYILEVRLLFLHTSQ
jgi:hypothetical protein